MVGQVVSITVLLLSLLGGTCAQGREVPVEVELRVQDAGLVESGRFAVEVDFEVLEDVERSCVVTLELSDGRSPLLSHRHRPRPPTVEWRAGQVHRAVIELAWPMDRYPAEGTTRLLWSVTFIDAGTRAVLRPRSARLPAMAVPRFRRGGGEDVAAAAIGAARELAKAGEGAAAWARLKTAFRLVRGDEPKEQLRDVLLEIGRFPPALLSPEEGQIVALRIEAERRRYLREVAGHMHDRKQLHGALRLLSEVGGKLQEQAREAVIEALSAAKRTEKDIQDIKREILQGITPKERATAQSDTESLGTTRKLLERGKSYLKRKRYALAIQLGRNLGFVEDRDLRREAFALVRAAEEAWLADAPPAEIRAAEAAINHPAWARTKTVATHEFVIIGPRRMIEGISAASRLNFDVGAIFITDLFGRIPNPEGDRVTVYFKELWNFGGGVGGGKTIDIGSAKPERRGVRLDTGLLYHEFTHCVDDTRPVFAGFREGLANLGAAFAVDAMGQKTDAWHSVQGNLEAFRKDYLETDLEYWRIQNYGPSAGFFLHFLDRYGREGKDYDWQRYRDFFRALRESPLRDGREPIIVRSYAWHLMEVFGPRVLDDLITFRFPLLESDRAALLRELEVRGSGALRSGAVDESDFAANPNSPVPRDLRGQDLRYIARASPGVRYVLVEDLEPLGILHAWRVIGPFKAERASPDARVFPPEYEIDFAREYHSGPNVLRWRVPGYEPPVVRHPSGWIRFAFPYQENSAIYALTNLVVQEAVDAVVHVRADDDVSVFVDDRLIGKYKGRNAHLAGREPLPDAMRFPARLEAGRRKLLLKIRNRRGGAGIAVAVSDRAGFPLPYLAHDAEPPEAIARPPEPRWRPLLRQAFDRRSALARFEVTAGRFRVQRKRLSGEATDGGIPWRKYTVRPGFPKDSPSNLAWLPAKATRKLGQDFRLDLDLAGSEGAPKICVMFMGCGGKEALGGWSLTVHPARGGDAVIGRLERYDRLVYQTDPVALPPPERRAEELRLRIASVDRRCSVTLGPTVLFDGVSIRPIAGRSRIGFCTWGPATRLRGIELAAPR